jgi:hypothetical protein
VRRDMNNCHFKKIKGRGAKASCFPLPVSRFTPPFLPEDRS